jgi:hypothetical protein
MAKKTCFVCGNTFLFGVVNDGELICEDCFTDDNYEPMDTPSLQDSNPEIWGYMNNVNPWGMEGGY